MTSLQRAVLFYYMMLIVYFCLRWDRHFTIINPIVSLVWRFHCTTSCTCILHIIAISKTLEITDNAYAFIQTISCRLEGVEARLQESSEAFERSREVAKKSKIEYEKVKKKRFVQKFLCKGSCLKKLYVSLFFQI